MSIMDTPLALIDRLLGRPPAIPPDEPISRMLERMAHELEPDPLYRRRLRGEVLNRFVAAREGLGGDRPAARPRRMTPIGRAVLIASVVLAFGAASVSAASQSALPGDGLYALKLRIEQLRIEVAPTELKDDLLVATLDARLAEVQMLADLGDWTAADAVADHAVAIASELAATVPRTSPATEFALAHRVTVLEALIARAPAAATPALERALAASNAAASAVKENGWRAADGPRPPGHATSTGDAASSASAEARPAPVGQGPQDPQGNGAGSGSHGPSSSPLTTVPPTPSPAPTAAHRVGAASEAPTATRSPRPSPPGPAETPRNDSE